jgi:alkylation response protein AidB-like acyl-CoA dehydrogenase
VLDGDASCSTGRTFITNGINADLVIVAAKTAPEDGVHGISVVVERDAAGLSRGQAAAKIGQDSLDTADLHFDDVRIPVGNLLGRENDGFRYLLLGLPRPSTNCNWTSSASGAGRSGTSSIR